MGEAPPGCASRARLTEEKGRAMHMISIVRSVETFSLVFPMFCAGCILGEGPNVGMSCSLGVDAGTAEPFANREALECPTRLCLKPALAAGQPVFSPPTGATCSADCNVDSDCWGEGRDSFNSLDTRCKTGFVCAVPLMSVPLCCRKLCTCRDFLGPTGTAIPPECQGAKAQSCDSP